MDDATFTASLASILRHEGMTIACQPDSHDDLIATLREIALDLPHALTLCFSTTGMTCRVEILSEVPATDNRIAYNRKVGMVHFRKWQASYPDLCHILPCR